MLDERRDHWERLMLHRALPVALQLGGMLRGPLEDQSEGFGRELPCQDCQRLDRYRCLCTPIAGVEVGCLVAPADLPVHGDDDSVERADSRHRVEEVMSQRR